MSNPDSSIPYAEPVTNPDTISGQSRVPTCAQNDVGSAPTSAGGEPVPALTSSVGQSLGAYRLLAMLGEGGMGTVFIAEDTVLRRQVALKVMLPRTAVKAIAKERFFREARAVARIENDFIVPIYQVGEDGGVPYLAMQLLKGESLGERLRRDGRPKLSFVFLVARQVALGLAAAHEKGLVHRDIKPDNIWIEPIHNDDGSAAERCKILDFGLARPQQIDEELLTQEGDLLGTPAYMAPEQGRGEPVDHRSDLFSLGCVLYEMASGRRAFTGDSTLAILTSLAVDRPADPSAGNPRIPPAVSALIMSLLEKEPAKRPGSAREVAEMIRKLEAAPSKKPKGQVIVRVAAKPVPVKVAPPPRRPVDDPTVKTPPAQPDPPSGRGKNLRLAVIAALTVMVSGGLFVAFNDRNDPEGTPRPAGPNSLIEKPTANDLAKNPLDGDFALMFDGRGIVEIPTLGIDPAGEFTVEAVIVQGPRIPGVQAPLASANRFVLRGGRTWAFHFLGGKTEVVAQKTTVPMVTEKRTHVAGVVSGDQVRLYVDGNLIAISPFDPSKPTDNIAGVFEIGRGFHGIIDEVRISNIARYAHKFAPPGRFKTDDFTLALYHCDEARGDTLYDSSGNRHDGQITGARWVPAKAVVVDD